MLVSVILQLLRRLNSIPQWLIARQTQHCADSTYWTNSIHLSITDGGSPLIYETVATVKNGRFTGWQSGWVMCFPQLHHLWWLFARIFCRKVVPIQKHFKEYQYICRYTCCRRGKSASAQSTKRWRPSLPIYTQRWWLSVETNPSLTADDTNSAIIVILQSKECPHNIILQKESIFLRRYWSPPKPFWYICCYSLLHRY